MKNFIAIKTGIASEPWNQRDGVVHMPADSPLLNGKFPLIVFYCGKSKATTDALLLEALPKFVEANGSVFGTLDSRKIKFAVVALTDQWWSPDPSLTQAQLLAVEKSYPGKVDYQHVFASGLSAGGQNSFAAGYLPSVSSLYAAVVPMSIAGFDRTPGALASLYNNKIESMFICGDADSFVGQGPSKDASAAANLAYPGSSSYFTLPGGHDDSVWYKAYDPATKFNGQSIYDFMLSQGLPVTPQPTPDPLPTPVNDVVATITGAKSGTAKVHADGTLS